jgi:hypothetical protein
LDSFNGGSKWIRNFIKRHKLRPVTLHGSGADADTILQQPQTIEAISNLKALIETYEPQNVFNMDETGLYYRCLPNKSFLIPVENKRDSRGKKSMKDKNRVTAFICTNITGTKVPLAYIGKSKTPRCFKKNKVPMRYFNQKNGWCDGVVAKKWFDDVFAPFVRNFTDKPVLLIMDNFGAHEIIDNKGQITIANLPPNVTSRKQPMDMGIIQNWKSKYRYSLLDAVVCRAIGREYNKYKLKNVAISVLDAMHIGISAWDSVTTSTILNCWIKADILPNAMQIYFENMRKSRSQNDGNINDVLSGISNLVLSEDLGNVLRNTTDKEFETLREARDAINADPNNALEWLRLEDNEDVCEAQVFDEC